MGDSGNGYLHSPCCSEFNVTAQSAKEFNKKAEPDSQMVKYAITPQYTQTINPIIESDHRTGTLE